MKNIGGGDLMRVLVEGNSPPVAQNDEGVVNEDGTLTVANSSNANVTGSYDAHQEHSGDLMDTSSASNSDSDPNTSEYGDTIKVTAFNTVQQVHQLQWGIIHMIMALPLRLQVLMEL